MRERIEGTSLMLTIEKHGDQWIIKQTTHHTTHQLQPVSREEIIKLIYEFEEQSE